MRDSGLLGAHATPSRAKTSRREQTGGFTIPRCRFRTALPPQTTPHRIRTLALVLATLALSASGAHAATKCTAAEFGCPPTGTCVLSGTHDVGTSCHLDFGTQNVEITGILRAAIVGDPFSISAGDLHLNGGKLRSTGDNTQSGGDITVVLTGRLWMSGSGSRIETNGNGGGGSIEITAHDVLIQDGGAIVADGGANLSCGDAGDVTISAFGGPVVLNGNATTVSAMTGGYDCSGGFVVIDGTSLSIQKEIDASGGGPFGISLLASPGDIVLAAGALIDARGRGSDEDFGNTGGDIDLYAPLGSIDLQGTLNSDGSGADGGGGDVQLDGSDALVVGDVQLRGGGSFASGGILEMTTLGDLVIHGSTDASGGPEGDGGTIDGIAQGDVELAAGEVMDVSGGFFGGGFLDFRAEGVLTADAQLLSRGGSGGDGGFIELEACRVAVSSLLDAKPGTVGKAGFIDLIGGTVTLAATASLAAEPCAVASCNTITMKSGAPSVAPGASAQPPLQVVLDPGLAPCCGNGVVDDGTGGTVAVGEQCEDGNRQWCDGCTPSCRLEPMPSCPSDGNECTQDCSPSRGCNYAPLSGVACADEPGGNVCTNDVCVAGTCTHPAIACDDGIECTVDGCDPVLGCQATPSDVLCDDGEDCTTEVCDPSSGDPATGCVTDHVADGAVCDDGSLCTTDDRCEDGACVPQGSPLPCDDGDECTFDDCDPDLGCLNSEDAATCDCFDGLGAPLPTGTACADGNGCTVGDTCNAIGACVPGTSCPDDGDPCTAQLCFGGLCIYVDSVCPGAAGCVEGEPCSDTNACTLGICTGGTCVAEPKPCSDGDACTGIEACHPAFGCRQQSHAPVGDPLCEGLVVDSFNCYRTRRTSGSPPFVSVDGVSVEDELWTRSVDMVRPALLCLPSSVDGSDPDAPAHEDWLQGYRVRSSLEAPAFEPQIDLEVENALGTVRLDARRPDVALAPAVGEVGSLPAEPVPPDPDAYSCYRVTRSKDAPRFPGIRGLVVEDAFGTLTVDVRRPMRLCYPASLEGSAPGAPDHPTHVLCYQVRTARGTPSFERVRSIHTTNPMGAGPIDASSISEICLPSSVRPASP